MPWRSVRVGAIPLYGVRNGNSAILVISKVQVNVVHLFLDDRESCNATVCSGQLDQLSWLYRYLSDSLVLLGEHFESIYSVKCVRVIDE